LLEVAFCGPVSGLRTDQGPNYQPFQARSVQAKCTESHPPRDRKTAKARRMSIIGGYGFVCSLTGHFYLVRRLPNRNIDPRCVSQSWHIVGVHAGSPVTGLARGFSCDFACCRTFPIFHIRVPVHLYTVTTSFPLLGEPSITPNDLLPLSVQLCGFFPIMASSLVDLRSRFLNPVALSPSTLVFCDRSDTRWYAKAYYLGILGAPMVLCVRCSNAPLIARSVDPSREGRSRNPKDLPSVDSRF